MNNVAQGRFGVEMQPQGEPIEVDGVNLGRMSLVKKYEGDLDAVGEGEMLTTLTPVQGSAGYVAVERVTGRLNDREGSFVLQHTGVMDRGAQALKIIVVPDSGTGDLAGLTGSCTIEVTDGEHRYALEYVFNE